MELSYENYQVRSRTNHTFRTFVCGNCGTEIDVPIYCGDRFCPTCNAASRDRARARAWAIVQACPKIKDHRWKFVTFTAPTQANAEKATEEIIAQFRRLRQRKWWKKNVWGGVYVIEITWSKNRWHVHIHAMVYSRYLPQHTLAAYWSSCGSGRIVDIRAMKSVNVVYYVTKYITKSEVPDVHRDELMQAMAGKRLFSVFGQAHNVVIPPKKPPYCCPDCTRCEWLRWSELTQDLQGIRPGRILQE